jgi:hypothetical protein
MAVSLLRRMRARTSGNKEGGNTMRREVWIFLFVLGVLFFSWPIISIFKDSLAISLFIIWLVFIALIFIASIFSEREDGGG